MMNRWNFLFTAPAAAGVGSTEELFTARATAQNSTPIHAEANFMVFSAEEIEAGIKALQASPGSKNLYNDKNFAVDPTVEETLVPWSSSGMSTAITSFTYLRAKPITNWGERQKALTAHVTAKGSRLLPWAQ